MPTYQPLIPVGTTNLSVDYANIQGNFQAANTSFGIDHIPFDQSTNNGYHTVLHQVPVSTTTSNPPNNQPINGYTATPGFGQVLQAQINDGNNTDEALYFLSGGNKLTQLTTNIQPSIGPSGYTSIPGGLILQWGVVDMPNALLGAVTFSYPFPKNCFNVSIVPRTIGSNPGAVVSIYNPSTPFSGLTKSQFFWQCLSTMSVTGRGFYWSAIGN